MNNRTHLNPLTAYASLLAAALLSAVITVKWQATASMSAMMQPRLVACILKVIRDSEFTLAFPAAQALARMAPQSGSTGMVRDVARSCLHVLEPIGEWERQRDSLLHPSTVPDGELLLTPATSPVTESPDLLLRPTNQGS